jgi:hypothetical protein
MDMDHQDFLHENPFVKGIPKIYRSYGITIGGVRTSSFRITINYEGITYYKDWHLLTYHELKKSQPAAKKGTIISGLPSNT